MEPLKPTHAMDLMFDALKCVKDEDVLLIRPGLFSIAAEVLYQGQKYHVVVTPEREKS